MTYSVDNINVDKTWEVEIQSATISGTHSVDLSTGNIFQFNLSGDTVLNYTGAETTAYILLNRCGTYSLTFGTESNWLTNEDEPLTGDNIIGGVYDGEDMWVSVSERVKSTFRVSLRIAEIGYTGKAIRVRRSSDDTEQDIGFDGVNLDETALLSFVGAGDGFIRTWYNQAPTGAIYNAIQTTDALQPKIVSEGVVEKTNGKPAIRFSGTEYLTLDQLAIDESGEFTNRSSIILTKADDVIDKMLFTFGRSTTGTPFISFNRNRDNNTNVADRRHDDNVIQSLDGPLGNTDQYLQSTLWTNAGGSSKAYRNGTLIASDTSVISEDLTTNLATIGCLRRNTTALFWKGTAQEIAYYDSFLSNDDRKKIEQGILNYNNV